MKKNRLLTLVATLAVAAFAHAGDDHDHPKQAGPNGGRVLTKVEPHAEFFVTPERAVRITFLDEQFKPLAPADQVVTVIAGERANPAKLTFTKDATGFLSTAPLPAGDNLPAVVQIKVTPDAATVTEKFNLNLAKCPTCAFAEYACTCAH